MKFNQWTVALAALGVVSLASAAKAEEQVNSVLTAVSSTTLSGYVDTSAQWNFGTGDANLPPYKFGGASKADGFNLDVVQLRIDKPLDEAQWSAGYRADLWFGPDANTLGTSSLFGNDSLAYPGDFAIRQAYVALRMPVGNGIDWKMGVFDSILGYESVESGNNPNYTRSWGHSIEPQTHTGLLASYRFSELISASAGVANTFTQNINDRPFEPVQTTNPQAESYKTYMGSIAVTAPESTGFLAGSTLYAGVVNGFSASYADNATSYYVGSTIATPVTGLRFGAAWDYLNVHHVSGETWALAGYASFQATEKLSLHLRGDYLRDRGDQKYFVAFDSDTGLYEPTNPDKVLTVTATVQYDLWKNVISRLELRWDHSLTGDGLYGGTTQFEGDMINAWMLAANLIYKF
jgi:hypothetical protein